MRVMAITIVIAAIIATVVVVAAATVGAAASGALALVPSSLSSLSSLSSSLSVGSVSVSASAHFSALSSSSASTPSFAILRRLSRSHLSLHAARDPLPLLSSRSLDQCRYSGFCRLWSPCPCRASDSSRPPSSSSLRPMRGVHTAVMAAASDRDVECCDDSGIGLDHGPAAAAIDDAAAADAVCFRPCSCSIFLATSRDGFIADEDGKVDWLNDLQASHPLDPNTDGDGGFTLYLSTIDAIIMGRKTYETVLGFLTSGLVTIETWPYGNLPIFVLTSRAQTSETTALTTAAVPNVPDGLKQKVHILRGGTPDEVLRTVAKRLQKERQGRSGNVGTTKKDENTTSVIGEQISQTQGAGPSMEQDKDENKRRESKKNSSTRTTTSITTTAINKDANNIQQRQEQFQQEQKPWNIYVDGGYTVRTFLSAGCISKAILTVVPITLGRGVSLLGTSNDNCKGRSDAFDSTSFSLKRVNERIFTNGFVQTTYKIWPKLRE